MHDICVLVILSLEDGIEFGVTGCGELSDMYGETKRDRLEKQNVISLGHSAHQLLECII